MLFVFISGVCNRKYIRSIGWAMEADCSSRRLHTVPKGLIENLQNLDLSGNMITEITVNDLQFPKLKILSLAGNNLSKLPADVFRNTTQLEQLDLSGNKITDTADAVFSCTPNLRTINGLHTISTPTNLFQSLNRLKTLSITMEDSELTSNIFEVNNPL